MKKLLPLFVLSILTGHLFAQQNLLSFDEHNKYIYYQVESVPGSADTLLQKGLKFLKADYPKITVKQNNTGKITAEGKFPVYGGVSVLRHEQGEITFQLNMEFKDQKYRFWLTGFIFTPYQRDRYGNFVPQTGVDIPLEQLSDKMDKKEASAYLDEAGNYCKQLGEKLKNYLLKLPEQKKVENPRKIVTDKW